MRLDFCPAVRAHFPASGTEMRVDASSRFRIARTDSSPGVALSTSF